MKKTLVLVLLSTAIACTQKQLEDVSRVTLTPVLEMDQFSDSTFFSDIRFMYAEHDLLYVSDYTRDQIMVLNDNGDLIETISSKGPGPGEMRGASSLVVRDDTLYVHNEASFTIDVFYKRQYLRSIKVPFVFSCRTSFGLSGNFAILTDFQPPHSLAFVNLYTDSVTHFGEMFDFQSPVKSRNRNHRFVCTDDSFIYAISDNQTIIERYDLQGNLVDSYDYSNIEEVKTRLDFINLQPNKDSENSVYHTIGNCYLKNGKLYLLLVTQNSTTNSLGTNQILEIDVNGNMQIKRVLDLGKGWFAGICFTPEYLWAFNRTACTLVKYELP